MKQASEEKQINQSINPPWRREPERKADMARGKECKGRRGERRRGGREGRSIRRGEEESEAWEVPRWPLLLNNGGKFPSLVVAY